MEKGNKLTKGGFIMYLIGIDVGGTFTDGALIKAGKIEATVKVATNNDNISTSLLTALDQLIDNLPSSASIERIVISTTAVTNLLVTEQAEPTALILMPGYGLPNSYYELGEHCYFLKGAIDFRGRVVEEIDTKEISQYVQDIKQQSIRRIAVSGKFSNRNDEHEKKVKMVLDKEYPEAIVLTSSEVSNQLNFARRAVTTYYTAMTYYEWNNFVDNVDEAIRKRGINTEVHVLKADGGTIPIDISRKYPCQTIYSGPAASTMGGIALTMDNYNSVVIDIGGTTTDISLIIAGEPLYASKGANIRGRYSHIEAFSLTSLPIGGDSQVIIRDGTVEVLNRRQDVAMCFGGKFLTVTDIFNTRYDLKIGNYQASQAALESMATEHKLVSIEIAEQTVNIVLEKLNSAINNMFGEWEQEPAYKVWEVVNKRKFKLERIIGIGAASTAIVPVLANYVGVPYYLHQYSPIANALGTAVARPTLNINLHVDTEQGFYSIQPNGGLERINNPHNFNLEDAKDLALNHLYLELAARGIENNDYDATFYMEEQFNVIRGYNRAGRIFDIGVQVQPGFIKEFKGVLE